MIAISRDDAIRARAFQIWEEEGRPDGRALEHWERACRELAARAESTVAPPAEPSRRAQAVAARTQAKVKSAARRIAAPKPRP